MRRDDRTGRWVADFFASVKRGSRPKNYFGFNMGEEEEVNAIKIVRKGYCKIFKREINAPSELATLSCTPNAGFGRLTCGELALRAVLL